MELYKTQNNRSSLNVEIFKFDKNQENLNNFTDKIQNWLLEQKREFVDLEENFIITNINQTETLDNITISIWFYTEWLEEEEIRAL